jgi:hypothetical protein
LGPDVYAGSCKAGRRRPRSLTGEIRDVTSPATRFLRTAPPNVDAVCRDLQQDLQGSSLLTARGGPIAESVLRDLPSGATVETLLALPDLRAIEDHCDFSRLLFARCSSLICPALTWANPKI